MSEGWRSDTGCTNEHHIPTLSPTGKKKRRTRGRVPRTLALHNSDYKNPSRPDFHIILIPVRS